jgi:hypothetical protein
LSTSLLLHSFWGSLVFELPVYSDYQSFVSCIATKYFLLLCGWSLQFRDCFFFVVQKFLNFM